MVELLNAANRARTALSGAITATATSFSVEDASSFPKPPFAITVEDEIMEVGTVSGNTFSNVTRGLEGTIAVAHEQGAPVENRFTAGTYNRMVDSFNEQKVKVIKVEQELNNFKTTLQQININQEATQQVTGYGVISLPKNAANGQFSDVVVKGLSLKNELNYNRETWEEWTKSKGVVGDNTGLTLTGGNAVASLSTKLKNNTKYVLLYYLLSSDATSFRLNSYYTGSVINLPRIVGNQAISFTTQGNITINALNINTSSDNVGSVKIKDIRIFELPAGSEIETDFNTMTADQLAQKYPYINGDSVKSTISASRLKSVGKNLMPSFDEWNIGSNIYINQNEIQVKFNNLFSSPFIKINPNTEYVLSFAKIGGVLRNRLCYYDENKNLIENTAGSLAIIWKINHPTAKYVKWAYYPSSDETEYRTIKNMQLEKGSVATEYEPYKESIAYINLPEPLRSVPSANDEIRDIIRITNGKAELIRKVGNKKDVPNGTVINYADMADDGVFEAWGANGEHIVGVKGDTLDFDAVELNYQLAEPIITPVQVSGTLVSYPSGTVYIERVVPDAGLYTDKMTVLHKDLPIKALERLSKIDYTTGLETELNVSQAVISSDKLSFTHPSLAKNDIVFFVYEYDRESTIPTTEIEYYDSRYVIKDKTTGKFYKWNIEVDNGVPNIVLTEV